MIEAVVASWNRTVTDPTRGQLDEFAALEKLVSSRLSTMAGREVRGLLRRYRPADG